MPCNSNATKPLSYEETSRKADLATAKGGLGRGKADERKLIPLGIPNVQFKVELTPKEVPDETGTDKINFLFSANKNGQLQPISQVASGVKSRASCSR